MADVQESPAPDPAVEPTLKRRPGNPRMVAGSPSMNPSGVERDDPDGGQITAARMRRALSTGKRKDTSPTDRALRTWLEKNPKEFIAATEAREREERGDPDLRADADRLRRENADLRARVAELEAGAAASGIEADPGSDAAMAVIEQVEAVLIEAGADVGPDGRCRGCGQRVTAGAVGPA